MSTKPCVFCNTPTTQVEGRKPRKYCSDTCRQKDWQAKKKKAIPLPNGYVKVKNIKAVTPDEKEVPLFKPAKPENPPLDITPMTYNDYLREAPMTKDKDFFKYRVQNDKKLNSRQRDMIYSKLK